MILCCVCIETYGKRKEKLYDMRSTPRRGRGTGLEYVSFEDVGHAVLLSVL